MAKSGVMTTDEFGITESARVKEQNKEEDKTVKTVEKPKAQTITDIYLLPSAKAQTGAGNCAFFYKGKEIKVKLEKGCFTIPKQWNAVKKQQYRTMLLETGFELQPTETIPVSEEVKEIVYTLMHPDHSEASPLNGAFHVKVNKKEIKLNIVNGRIQTMDPRVRKELKKKGFAEDLAESGSE